ncbi:MAG TPA: response regulator [Flavisolibacter sp.]
MLKTNPKQPHTILWADDDPDDRLLISGIVSSYNSQYQVKEAEDGCEVLRYLQAIQDPAHLPCLVVLDINMPKLTGLETLACIRENAAWKNLTVAVFTTSSNKHDRQTCTAFGVPMFTKPATFEGFQQAVETLLKLCDIEPVSPSSN